MAPLAATVATGAAIKFGLSLARAERARRREGRLKEQQRLGLYPGEPLAGGLQRMALAQVDLVLELLGAGGQSAAAVRAPDAHAVHETRKAIKRLRAVLRLLRGELGERAYERENDALREIARRLSGARDATVMLATLDGLIARHPRQLGQRRGVLALRRRVLAESERAQRGVLAGAGERGEVIGELQALRWRVASWALPGGAGVELVDGELQRLYRQGRRRLKTALSHQGERSRELHMWRKRVKDLRYVAEMLERRDVRGGGHKGGRPRGQKHLHEVATRADELGELLGEEHDLAVLDEHLRAAPKHGGHGGLWQTGRGTRKTLLKLLGRRRHTLQRRVLRRGRSLYGPKPGRLARAVRRS